MFKYSNRVKNFLTVRKDHYPDKHCKECNSVFTPVSSNHLYCSDNCADRGHSRHHLRKMYNISLEQYETMMLDPHCRICGSEGFVISKNGKAKLAIDHDHLTGKVRGLLCHNCNRALGLLKDDINILQRAIEYLKGATTILKESTDKCLEAPDPSEPTHG